MTELAAVISGFEMIVFLQFIFSTTIIPHGLQLAYVATSGLTVSGIRTSYRPIGTPVASELSVQNIFA